MVNKHNDIGDDEIRIISSATKSGSRRPGRRFWVWAVVAGLLLAAVVIKLLASKSDDPAEELTFVVEEPVTGISAAPEAADSVETAKGYASLRDTVVNNVELTILTPEHATAVLEVGADVLEDSAAVLVAQAADIRGDNGDIVGSYVLRGELLSKGEAKAGFCSIINGNITVGVADATPMLEQALMSDGYFFRQYPLVVGGQVVDNKPKGRAIRKALAEIDGKFCVIISRKRLTFHDFSQTLVDLGVRNAIYLVGAGSLGFYRDEDDNKVTFGHMPHTDIPNVNFIVWR